MILQYNQNSVFRVVIPNNILFCYLGDVGPPLRCNYIKLTDVADMNYNTVDNKGEVGTIFAVCLYRK